MYIVNKKYFSNNFNNSAFNMFKILDIKRIKMLNIFLFFKVSFLYFIN